MKSCLAYENVKKHLFGLIIIIRYSKVSSCQRVANNLQEMIFK